MRSVRKLLRKLYNSSASFLKTSEGQQELKTVMREGLNDLRKAKEQDSRKVELEGLENLNELLKNA